MFIDAMAHLNDPRVNNLEGVLNRASAAGITHIVNAGVNPCTDFTLPIIHSPRVYKAYGIHPMAVGQDPLEVQLETLKVRLEEENVVAIGEIGLDKRDAMPAMQLQIQAFQAQLKLAQEMNLPVILHAVKTTRQVLDEVQNCNGLGAGGVWHGFTGSVETIKQIEKLGLHISIGGQATYPNSKKCRLAIPEIRADRLLLESDSPDHPPIDWQEAQSEPSALEITVQEIAKLRGESIAMIKKQTSENAVRLFKMN